MTSDELGYWARYSLGRRVSRRQVLRGGVVLGAGLFATSLGCGSSEPSSQQSIPTAAATASTPKLTSATFTAAVASDVGNMDPQSIAGTGGGNWENYLTHFNCLLWVQPDTSELMGELAESFEVLDGGKAYKFKVRPNVTFHNGEALTAETVKWNLDRVLGRAAYNKDYKSGLIGQFPAVGDVEVTDPMTVVVHMNQLDVVFPYRLYLAGSGYGFLPKKYVETVGDEETARKPVGTGPFKFVSWKPDSEIRSTRYDDYFRPLTAKEWPRVSIIKDVVQKIIPEEQARVAALLNGEVDQVLAVSADNAKQLESQKGLKVVYIPGDQPMHLQINTIFEKDPDTGEPNPWRDKRVRQAANMAIDLDTMIKTLMTGKEKRSYGSSSRSYGFPKDIATKNFKYDPAGAKQLLAAAGYPNGFKATIYGPIGRWNGSREVMEAIAGYFSKVGINATVQELTYQVVTTKLKDKSLYPLCFWGMNTGPDAGPNFRYGYHTDSTYGLSNPDPIVDQWIEQSEKEFDPAKRAVLVGQIITKFYEDAQWVFLNEPVGATVLSDKWIWDPAAKIWPVATDYWNMRPVGS